MKKCPPGVICIENMTMALIFIITLCILYVLYSNFNIKKQNIIVNNHNHNKNNKNDNYGQGDQGLQWFPNIPYSNDVLLNPYTPPLRDERYLVPINVSTNIGAVDANYRQVGILTPVHGSSKDNILPLMGRPLFTNRDKWNYFSTSNQHNNVKLPITKNGRSCTNEYGCDRLYSGNKVYVEGANEAYKVTMYDNDTIRYLPAL